uniref:CSON007782 protein n=1 Tax=Culicoides sonorensis TaxID=179676 RepID=A0A336M231_CULSO
MIKITFLFALLGLFSISQVFGRLLITNVHVDSNPDYVKSNVQLKKVNGRVLITGDGYVLQDIESDVVVSGSIAVLNNGHYEPILRIEPLSFCKFLTGKRKSPLMKLVYKMISKFGRMPQTCPIKKGHYFVNDFEVDEGFIPALAPAADYRVEIQAFVDELGVQKQIHKIVSHASIIPDEEETDVSSESQEAQ